MKFAMIFVLSIVAPFGVLSLDGEHVGDMVCVEGYPMDYYCIEDGFLLDNPSVVTLEGPDKHSVHCLIDVPVCIASAFEILTPPITGETLYQRAYRLDDSTKATLVDLAKKSGDCSDCEGGGAIKTGLKVVVQGSVTAIADGDTPAIISGTVKLSNPDSVGCPVPVQAGSPTGTETIAPFLSAPTAVPISTALPLFLSPIINLKPLSTLSNTNASDSRPVVKAVNPSTGSTVTAPIKAPITSTASVRIAISTTAMNPPLLVSIVTILLTLGASAL